MTQYYIVEIKVNGEFEHQVHWYDCCKKLNDIKEN